MIRQATVEDVANKRITRLHGQVVVVTRYYPRFLKRPLIHEYLGKLAPTRELLAEFKACEAATGNHDQAFDDVAYESKFSLTRDALAELARLAELAKTQTVFLVCHCKIGTRCHREILMLMAHALYQAPIAKLHFDWKTIRARLPSGLTRDGGEKEEQSDDE